MAIVQRRITHYRVEFFNSLKSRLAENNIKLRLMHGEATPREKTKQDAATIDWAEAVPTRYLLGQRFNWMSFMQRMEDVDLAILTQENAQLANQFALVRRPAKQLAFWGHGGNLQGDYSSLRERYKRWTTLKVDWYFAYTQLSVELVAATGFPRQRITCVNNTIDLQTLQEGIAISRTNYSIADGPERDVVFSPVGLFLGSIYPDKELGLLLLAAKLIRQEVPNFQLIIAGAGPDEDLARRAASDNSWITFMGPVHGEQKWRLLSQAALYMNPGLIGLGILDAFAAGIPVLTTNFGRHSPEISYLDASNGISTPHDPREYATAAVRLLRDQSLRSKLCEGSRLSADKYGLDKMVANFSDGINTCLNQKRTK